MFFLGNMPLFEQDTYEDLLDRFLHLSIIPDSVADFHHKLASVMASLLYIRSVDYKTGSCTASSSTTSLPNTSGNRIIPDFLDRQRAESCVDKFTDLLEISLVRNQNN